MPQVQRINFWHPVQKVKEVQLPALSAAGSEDQLPALGAAGSEDLLPALGDAGSEDQLLAPGAKSQSSPTSGTEFQK